MRSDVNLQIFVLVVEDGAPVHQHRIRVDGNAKTSVFSVGLSY